MTNTRARTWFITGVSTGLGQALAAAALARGDLVAGTVRTAEAAARFQRSAARAYAIRLDLRDTDAVFAAVAEAEAWGGGIDIVVNNAGYGLVGGVEEASLAEIRAQFEVNFFGAVAVLHAVLPAMRRRGTGRILNVTSVSGQVGWPSLGVYSASKFALEGLSETLALELKPLGIDLTIIEPGGLRTDFATRSRADTARTIADYAATVGQSRRILAEHAGHEGGDPERAAAAILALADMAAPPLRLLLGSDALGYVRAKLAQQVAEIDRWEALTRSSDRTDEVLQG